MIAYSYTMVLSVQMYFKEYRVTTWYMLKKCGCVQKQSITIVYIFKNNLGIQNHGITIVDVQKIWFYHGTCPKTWNEHSTVDVDFQKT